MFNVQSEVLYFFSVVCYLNNLFRDNSYKNIKQNVQLLKNQETTKLFEIIETLINNYKSIHMIELIFYDNKNNSSLYLIQYKMQNKEITEKKYFIRHLQRIIKIINRNVYMRIRITCQTNLFINNTKKVTDLIVIENYHTVKLNSFINVITNFEYEKKEFCKDLPEKTNFILNNTITKKNTYNCYKINCGCNINKSYGDMLQCDLCQKWSHTVCNGYFSNAQVEKKSKTKCMMCTDENVKKNQHIYQLRRIVDILYNDIKEIKLTELKQVLKKKTKLDNKKLSELLEECKKQDLLQKKKSPEKYYKILPNYTEKAKENIKKIFRRNDSSKTDNNKLRKVLETHLFK